MTIEYKDSKRISALSTDTYTTTTTYDHLTITGTESSRIATGYYLREGVKILTGSPAIGTQILNVEMSLRKIGSPTGNLTYVVRDATDSVVGTSGTLDVSTLTGSFADYELSFSSPVTLGVDYHVAIEYNGGGVSDYLAIELKNETSETGYSWSQYTSSWSELTSYNIAITFDSNPTTVTKPTNVQDNSILVEKDTGNRYWRTPPTSFNKSSVLMYYNFEQSPNTLTNQATSGNGFTNGNAIDGTTGGCVTAAGKLGTYSWDFDGTNFDNITTSLTKDWTADDWSMSIWINIDSVPAGNSHYTGVFGNRFNTSFSTSASNWFTLGVIRDGSTGQLERIVLETGGGSYTMVNTGINPVGSWHHVVLTHTGSTLEMFVDGVSKGSATNSNCGSTSNGFQFGRWYYQTDANSVSLDGKLDEFYLFSKVLTSDEISSIYNSGTGSTVSSAMLPATWTMNPTYTGSSVTKVTSGGYSYIKFLEDGTLNTQGLDVEVLVVGGGGGGGQYSTGGAGGGAVLLTDSFTPTSGSLDVTVGAGGLKGGGGLTGGNSSYDGNIAGGGGGGGYHAGGSSTGLTGGNSGGAGGTGQHVAGGGGGSGGASLKAGVTGYTSTNHTGGVGSAQHYGGGGGGAGAGGSNSTTSAGGNGVGGSSYTALNSFLSNSSTGVEETSGNWWVGGAAGGGRLNGGAVHAGTGTSGKGGAGNGSAGVANTGGGGSNHAWDGGNFNGGSGIVVVRHTV